MRSSPFSLALLGLAQLRSSYYYYYYYYYPSHAVTPSSHLAWPGLSIYRGVVSV